MPISFETYERVALEDGDARWELVCGQLRRKPDMTIEHSNVISSLAGHLFRQIDETQFVVRINSGQLRASPTSAHVPDIFVVSQEERLRLQRERSRRLEVHDSPMPLVVEVWSRSTGGYDVRTQLRDYQQRGDTEIWRFHPYRKTLTAWRRQPDGSYSETVYRGGTITPVALPGVTIDIERLFA